MWSSDKNHIEEIGLKDEIKEITLVEKSSDINTIQACRYKTFFK